MRVALHAGQLLQPVPGGIGSYVDALLQHLPDQGIDTIAFAAGGRPLRVPPRVPWIDLGGPHGSVRYESWHRLRRPLVRIDADVVHAPSLAIPPTRVPFVATVHDVAFLRVPGSTTERGIRFHTRGLELARKHAQLVITPSKFTAAELVSEGFEPQRCTTIPLGVDPAPARPDDEVAAAVAAAGVHEPYILTVGTVEPRKDLPTLIAAVDRARRTRPDLSLVISGPRGWGDVHGLDRPFVHVIGRQPWRVVDALYRRADVFVTASIYEGFGLPALEAMARGAPTVATTGSSIEEFVRDAGLLFTPHDVDGCTDAIERILEDGDFAEQLRKSALARADEMSWARSAALHADAYRRVASRAGS